MKKAKLKKIEKKEKNVQKDTYSFKNLLLIIVILVVLFSIFYFITTLFVKPEEKNVTNNQITEINSKKIVINKLLSQKEEEYYVIATKKPKNSKANYLELYNNYIEAYKKEEGSLPFYNVNLDDAINKSYIGDKLNISDNIDELKVNNEVLFKIKDGKIDKYYVGNKDILDALSKLKES